jgi:hypothetical protein
MGWASKKSWLNSWQIFFCLFESIWAGSQAHPAFSGYHSLCPSDYSDKVMLLTIQLRLIYGWAYIV